MVNNDEDDDIEKCLTSLGIEKRQLIPTNITQKALRQRPELNQFRNEINIFPLEWFDSDSDWQFLPQCSSEGLAFLPNSSHQSLEINADDFEWRKVTVEMYNEKANKWRIKELTSGARYEVPRIYLMFIVKEKPLKFAEKIRRAVELRSQCQNKLKFDAVVDGIILSEIPKPPQRQRDNIRNLLYHSFNNNNRWIEIFEGEYIVVYQKTLAALELIKFNNEKEPHSFPSPIQLPTMEPKRKLKILTLDIKNDNNGTSASSFLKSRRDFQKLWLNCRPETIKIMEFINNACKDVTRMSLFHIEPSDICSLMGFVDANNKKLSVISNFLKEKWVENVVASMKLHLFHVGKGWFDLNVNDWGIYQMSKLYRLIELIKLRMEIAVRLMLRSSLQAFVNHLCQPCESMLNVAEDFVWGNDLVTSRFPSPQPVFSLDLNFVNGEAGYMTTKLKSFLKILVEMFKSRISLTHEVPHIDPYLVTQLKFDKSLRLSSVGFFDDEIQNQMFDIRRCYQVVLIPLRAYAKEYQKFIEFMSHDNADFAQSFIEGDKTPKETKEKISLQLTSIEEIELTVPMTIVIGPFQINVNSLKKDMIVKRRDLYDRLLASFGDKVKGKLLAINEQYEEIFVKLTKKCGSIEELLEIREKLIPQIPVEILQLQKEIKKMTAEFDIFEFFHVSLPNDTFQLKISALAMPKKINEGLAETEFKLKADYEVFRKYQSFQESQFPSKVDVLVEDVELYIGKHDFDELSRVALKINDVWNALNEMVTLGQLLNNRQQIFNQPEIDTEPLNVLVTRLHPHHTLWTTASNFLKSKDDWIALPLSSVDMVVIVAEVNRCEGVLHDSRIHFNSHSEMMVLIEKILVEVDAFGKIFDIMKALTNQNLDDDHWASLSEKTGISMTSAISIELLLARGILKHLDVVQKISIEATREYEVKLEVEEMARKRLEDEAIMKQKKALRPRRNDI